MSEAESEDVALPFDVATISPAIHEETDMPTLPNGAALRIPELAGRWSVWSQSDETPGAYFVVPLNDEAREVGVKYAVIRAKKVRGSDTPIITLIRTDPQSAGLGA